MYKKIILSLFLVLSISIREVFSQSREEDSLALVDLYNSTNGDEWIDNTNWKSGPINTWYGVTVEDDRVTQLNLLNNNLTGTIPSSIGDLTSLTLLWLGSNQLTGSIPSEIWELTNLTQLSFYNNQLTGSIPSEVGQLINLMSLSLNRNQLLDSIPAEIGNLTQLMQLYLYGNQLTGSIPPEIGNLTKLLYLRLEENQLEGSVPPEMRNLTNLKLLYLGSNELTGSIPPEIGNLINLGDLQLQDNQLTDSIPPEIGNLTSLIQLYLYGNQLTGSIPTEVGNLTSLHNLILNNNQLTGTVPSELGNLSSLSHLYLYNNDLVDLPELSSLNALWVQNNKFTFEDIEPNIGISDFNYSPQDSVGEAADTTINEGSSLTMSVSVGGENNEYQWEKDESVIPGATESSYTIISAEPDDSGSYICEITNTVATELTLYSKPINVAVNTSGVPNDLPVVYSMSARGLAANKKFEVRYSIPENTSIKLGVYSINGTKVKEFSEEKTPGIYSKEIDMKNNPAGVYLLKMEANKGNFRSTKKIVLVN
jgi:Leucine-rich repeat (LRR) protein